MEIAELRTGEEDAWDSYVYESDASTFYHQIGWRNVVEKTYGHKPRYLVAREGDAIVGVLPMFLMESRVFGRKLVSVPFAPYGGVCADDAGVGRALVEEGVGVARDEGVDYFEIRGLSDDERYGGGFVTNDTYFTLVMGLVRDPELVWQRFNRKVRNATRKAMKSGLEVVTGADYLMDLYRIYARNMRDLGAPVHAHSFYANLQEEFPEQTQIAVVRCDGRVIAGIFLLYFRDTVISGWASSDKSYQRFNPNNLLYWAVIKDSCEGGYEYFDFGRSIADSGTYRFKKPWGAEVAQLCYQYYLNKGKKMPDTSQISPKRKMFAEVWRRMPVSLAERVGPRLRRSFP
ncbi:MAG: FemAB family protein [Candidatus Methanolliviera sp. GoM_oil]|nr:MAG: FemAB family protein [Candidatus Methanolliviera sp. GoM_oil]